jgi:hypothetical protein
MSKAAASSASKAPATTIRGAGFDSTPAPLKAADFGVTLPDEERLHFGAEGVRQRVLLDTLRRLEEASAEAKYHKLAQQNLARWSESAAPPPPPAAGACTVRIVPGDWGEVTLALTKEYGATFAALNMANAYGPGGGYTDGMVAQEENMFRRTDCHFSLRRGVDFHPESELYLPDHTDELNAKHERVYIDAERPRVCIRGPEDRSRADLGYEYLADDDVFPFYELRAAAVDLRQPENEFSQSETVRRCVAQLETLTEAGVRHVVLSAFGCGAFYNPADRVAAAYREALTPRAANFDVVAFGIFHAGYGPNNYGPFEAEFENWPGPPGSSHPKAE